MEEMRAIRSKRKSLEDKVSAGGSADNKHVLKAQRIREEQEMR